MLRFFDFVRCQRADGSFYGTAGRCQKGREVGPKSMQHFFHRYSTTKKRFFQDLVDKTEGLSGVHKDLGNGIYIIRGDAGKIDSMGYLPGFPKAVASVVGENKVVVARKTHRPWENLKLPEDAIIPRRKNAPMKGWIETGWKGMHELDVDMAVNPLLLTAESLLRPAYEMYNREFFGNTLPKNTELYIAPSMTAAHGVALRYRDPSIPYSIILSWKHLRDATEEAIHGIFLHEMVHINDFTHGQYSDTDQHGKIFRRKLDEIDRKWKRDSRKVYPDQILSKPDAKLKGTKWGPYIGRQFPDIKATPELKARATHRTGYIKRKWK